MFRNTIKVRPAEQNSGKISCSSFISWNRTNLVECIFLSKHSLVNWPSGFSGRFKINYESIRIFALLVPNCRAFSLMLRPGC